MPLFAVACLLGACAGAEEVAPASELATTSTAVSTTIERAPTAAATMPATAVPRPPPAPPAPVYDNTEAIRACTLLARTDVAAAFPGVEVGEATPIDPYCQWRVGPDGFVALTVWAAPISRLRAYPGLPVGDEPDVGDAAFWASNKQLFFGVGGTAYSLQFQRGAEWVDSNRPKLRVLALAVLDRLGYVPKPKPTTTLPPLPTVDTDGDGVPDATTTSAPTTTTSAPRPVPKRVAPPPTTGPPAAPIDLRRPVDASRPLRIFAGGDSIAGGPAWAIGQAARATGVAIADTEFQVGTGLVRPDFFDWRRHLAAIADARDPEVMVLLFGANDIQPIDLPDGSTVGFGDPRWSEEYRRRVAAVMDALAVRGRQVVWVGLPPMEAPAYSAQMAALNEIYRDEAGKRAPWVDFLDTWSMFSPPDEPGTFTRTLPGPDGQSQPVRFDDIHFNVPGSERLAAAVMDRLRRVTSLPPT